MTIYRAIVGEHDFHRELLEGLAQTSGDTAERRALWQRFYCDVKAHAAAEEETLYAKLIATEDGQPDARHSVHEHQELDDIMEELDGMDMSSPGWLARFKVLKHDYEHHIDEEEDEIFTRAREEIGEDDTNEIGRKFQARKDRELDIVGRKAEEALED